VWLLVWLLLVWLLVLIVSVVQAVVVMPAPAMAPAMAGEGWRALIACRRRGRRPEGCSSIVIRRVTRMLTMANDATSTTSTTAAHNDGGKVVRREGSMGFWGRRANYRGAGCGRGSGHRVVAVAVVCCRCICRRRCCRCCEGNSSLAAVNRVDT
jgi:hypothetical protein